jgi:carbon-monoxide dehydrogenase medium subunit
MYDFDYHRPTSLDEAVRLLAGADEARALAGGQTLLPSLKMRLARPAVLVDLKGIAGLDAIARKGDALVIGALARHAAVAGSALVRETIPALAALAGGIGDTQVRNRGTIGGSVANSDPSADYPAALLGLGATVTTSKREIAADDFFTGMFETALGAGEIITAIAFPVPRRAAYVKYPSPASRYAMVGVFVADTAKGVRVGVTGAAPYAFRWKEAEVALDKKLAASAIDSLVAPSNELLSDTHGDARYRASLIVTMTRRAVAAALN